MSFTIPHAPLHSPTDCHIFFVNTTCAPIETYSLACKPLATCVLAMDPLPVWHASINTFGDPAACRHFVFFSVTSFSVQHR